MKPALFSLIGVIALAFSLVLAHAHPFGDAHLHAVPTGAPPLMEHASVPNGARTLLIEKCADCHSENTHSPWYSNFAPASWLMERDIIEGRKHMNLSTWETLTPDQQQTLIAKIVQQTHSGAMSPLQYRIIHWNARITDADQQTLTAWARSAPGGDVANSSTTLPANADQGRAIYKRRCIGCHSFERDLEGPRLDGVYGRVSGTVPKFGYSDALRKAHITWTEESLDRWLADPDALVPGNNMEFHVAKPDERRHLIAFLKQISTH
ncbi:MAG TPA: heme-binding domain-containing protein [Edaphobacter sp.]